jgi:hypothetical protein
LLISFAVTIASSKYFDTTLQYIVCALWFVPVVFQYVMIGKLIPAQLASLEHRWSVQRERDREYRQETLERQKEQDERIARVKAVFPESCKKAGELIHRTAENVDGVLLLPLRYIPGIPDLDYSDFFFNDFRKAGQGYHYVDEIKTVSPWPRLQWKRYYRKMKSELNTSSPTYEVAKSELIGEKDPATWTIDRNKADRGEDPDYDRHVQDFISNFSPDPMPRYVVTEHVVSSTREEEINGIKGTSWKVIDLQTKEVLAERINFYLTFRAGNPSMVCLTKNVYPRNFIESVLKPSPPKPTSGS